MTYRKTEYKEPHPILIVAIVMGGVGVMVLVHLVWCWFTGVPV